MAKPYIPLSDANTKVIKNFIGMCRMNGLEGPAAPAFNFKENREGVGIVHFDMYYDFNGITEPLWKIIVKVDTDLNLVDGNKLGQGSQGSYLDSYIINAGSLDLEFKNSRFNEFKW